MKLITCVKEHTNLFTDESKYAYNALTEEKCKKSNKSPSQLQELNPIEYFGNLWPEMLQRILSIE